MASTNKIQLSASRQEELLQLLEIRFEKHLHRHEGLEWEEVEKRLKTRPEKLWSLNEMERTGGEPDCIGRDEKTGGFLFFDCTAESPKGRRSLCYDKEALEARKKFKPKGSAVEMAAEMGVELLTEEEYRQLQQLGEFDLKTSSWLKTPPEVRNLGGAIFGDRRYDRLFIYHNGAESYYAARGFRASLRI
ncbi:MAG: DUF4256 domain-containing protein [Salinimicrobium sp.]